MALTNVDLDPSAQMNIWLSSAANHQWNPNQKTPETPWEAEIDKLMQAQTAAQDPAKRKAYFDKVQQIVADKTPSVPGESQCAVGGFAQREECQRRPRCGRRSIGMPSAWRWAAAFVSQR